MGTQISIASVINSLVNQVDSAGASPRVVHAIKTAASKTGVDFTYLMQKASQESSFDPTAKATTSSATGLFQFTNQTWLHMIKNYGDQYGLGKYASQISENSEGRLTVENTVMRQAILALREDPQISAEMAGELDKENAAVLQQKVGGKIGGTELYLAHFLGAAGASNFIREMRSNPKAAAAEILPTAAAANQSVFYSKSGQERSLQQIYQQFAEKFGTGLAKVANLTPTNSNLKTTSTADISAEASVSSQATAVASAVSALQSQTNAENGAMISTGFSTLFSAMILGQVQDMELDTTSPLSAYNEKEEGKKKDAYAALSIAA